MLNAALFQPTSEGSIHVYLKDLRASIPEEPYDIWNGSRFLFAKDLFPDKLSDLGGKVLRATTFQNFPTTYQVNTIVRRIYEVNLCAKCNQGKCK